MSGGIKVGWGAYGEWSGPWVRGSRPFVLPDGATTQEKRLAVIAATEGGHFDAVNAYDRCIVSAGLLQVCEAGIYGMSDLLGAIGETSIGLLRPLAPGLTASCASFHQNSRGRWRFHFQDARGEVDRTVEQRQLFLKDSDGTKDGWDDASRAHAKGWALDIATVLAQPETFAAQIAFAAGRLMNYATPFAKATLWGPKDPADGEGGWVGAARAGYLSFAANLPAVASRHLGLFIGHASAPKWSAEWCIEMLKRLTFGPQIAIYPHRYQAIRPVLERLYVVDLPDGSADLARWRTATGLLQIDGAPDFMQPRSIQEELIAEGYDLGPRGADGVIGPKTRAALMTFQRLAGLQATGMPDFVTARALSQRWQKRAPREG